MTKHDTFISCDWGTSSFRLRLIQRGEIESEIRSACGIRSIHESLANEADRNEAFGGYLTNETDQLLEPAADVPNVCHVIISGMATSTIGWRELPYAKAPVGIDGANLSHHEHTLVTPQNQKLRIHLISGVRTEQDVMRGEETELIGLLNHEQLQHLANRCLVLLPGTHSKHITVKGGQIVNWRTFMTGEMFEALTSATILRQTTETSETGADSNEDFRQGAIAGLEMGMEAGLFQTRTRSLLQGIDNLGNREYLSGLLIGSELRHVYDAADDSPCLLAAPPELGGRYMQAIEIANTSAAQPIVVTRADRQENAAIEGHAFLLKRWLESGEIDAT